MIYRNLFCLMTLIGLIMIVQPISASASVFSDVPTDYWAYDYIIAIYDAGITTGCAQDDPNTPENERRYCPENSVARDQMAAFIVRAKEGEPAANYCDSDTPFPDVTPDMWSCKYIKRLKELGITTGYQDGTYGPYDNVPRDQMAAFIVRAKEGEPASNYCSTGSLFSDVDSSHWACKYIKRLYELGITTGCGQNPLIYCPNDIVTRAQMAAFLARAFLGANGSVTYKLTTEEALLSASQGSSAFNDTLNYARELGYTGALENVTEYSIPGNPSVFIATISNNAGQMVTIVYDARTQPVFLPAYLILPESENRIRLITRNGGLLIDNATGSGGPQISVIEEEIQKTPSTKLFSQTSNDCKQAFIDTLYCIVDKMTDIPETIECTVGASVCIGPLLLAPPPIDWVLFAGCMLENAGLPCGLLAISVWNDCEQEILGVPCDDQNDCTSSDSCNLIGQCKGIPKTECVGGDGCCPPGCNNLNDSDCEEEECDGPPYLVYDIRGANTIFIDLLWSREELEEALHSYAPEIVTYYCNAASLPELIACLPPFPMTVSLEEFENNIGPLIESCEESFW